MKKPVDAALFRSVCKATLRSERTFQVPVISALWAYAMLSLPDIWECVPEGSNTKALIPSSSM